MEWKEKSSFAVSEKKRSVRYRKKKVHKERKIKKNCGWNTIARNKKSSDKPGNVDIKIIAS